MQTHTQHRHTHTHTHTQLQYCEIRTNIENFIEHHGEKLIWLVRTKEEKKEGRERRNEIEGGERGREE